MSIDHHQMITGCFLPSLIGNLHSHIPMSRHVISSSLAFLGMCFC